MLKKLMKNCRKPEGLAGRVILQLMNIGHGSASQWGLAHFNPAPNAKVLDIGCGGGANIARILQLCPEGFVEGLDYSIESVAASRKKNAGNLGRRCAVRQGSVSDLPYENESFDAVTAFETVYFWPDIENDLAEVRRVLRPGGQFLICNNAGSSQNGRWEKLIGNMKIYSQAELAGLLAESGFEIATLDSGKNGFCLLATKK